MGLGAISYGLTYENKPKRIVVTEIDEKKIQRTKEVISESDALKHGVELIYVNTSQMEDYTLIYSLNLKFNKKHSAPIRKESGEPFQFLKFFLPVIALSEQTTCW